MASTANPAAPQPLHDDFDVDPADSARAAGLRYVTDAQPGIHRESPDDEFQYIAPDGTVVDDEKTLQRIRSLRIPPAWTDVWICAIPRGHIQATGRDAKGRKQYRYHPCWREVRDETKYERMLAFGAALPRIRERVDHDLALPGLPREKVLATVVRLLESTLIRVGNEEYAHENKSFGLTTMRNRHVDVDGTQIHFRFRGKSGKTHNIDVKDARLARVVKRLRDLPGYEVFQYLDEDGERRNVESDDINAYLHDITDEHFTAKDFRTWAGTVLAAQALQEFEAFDSAAQAKKNVVRAVEAVAQRLGNTPAVCRKCYVHPEVIDAYLDGSTIHSLQHRVAEEMSQSLSGLRPEEAAVMAFLQERLARDAAQLGAAS